RGRGREQQCGDQSLCESHNPSVGGAVPSAGARPRRREQAKCHAIPDFREIEIKDSCRFRPPVARSPVATLEPAWQLLVRLARFAIPDSCVRSGVGLRSPSLASLPRQRMCALQAVAGLGPRPAGARCWMKERDMAQRVRSADTPMALISLPQDTFTSRMASAWRDRAPRVVERDGRLVWISGDSVLGPWGAYGPGVTGGRRGRILAEAGFASGKQ